MENASSASAKPIARPYQISSYLTISAKFSMALRKMGFFLSHVRFHP